MFLVERRAGIMDFLNGKYSGILIVLFNRQIMAYLGTNAPAVYGVIVNVSTLVQCLQYRLGIPAYLFHKLRCRERGEDSGGSELCAGNCCLSMFFPPIIFRQC